MLCAKTTFICPECGEPHIPELPHNLTPMYRGGFYKKNGRGPNWEDAAAHCHPDVRKEFLRILKEVKKEYRQKKEPAKSRP